MTTETGNEKPIAVDMGHGQYGPTRKDFEDNEKGKALLENQQKPGIIARVRAVMRHVRGWNDGIRFGFSTWMSIFIIWLFSMMTVLLMIVPSLAMIYGDMNQTFDLLRVRGYPIVPDRFERRHRSTLPSIE